ADNRAHPGLLRRQRQLPIPFAALKAYVVEAPQRAEIALERRTDALDESPQHSVVLKCERAPLTLRVLQRQHIAVDDEALELRRQGSALEVIGRAVFQRAGELDRLRQQLEVLALDKAGSRMLYAAQLDHELVQTPGRFSVRAWEGCTSKHQKQPRN